MDAITLLKQDHKTVKRLFKELETTTERGVKTRQELLDRIEQEIALHTAVEEEIFYPAFREVVQERDDRILYLEAIEEHRVADDALVELKNTHLSLEVFAARAKVLKELIEHHADEEEKDMFPQARKLMDRSTLAQLGEEMLWRKQQLLQGQFASAKTEAMAARRAR